MDVKKMVWVYWPLLAQAFVSKSENKFLNIWTKVTFTTHRLSHTLSDKAWFDVLLKNLTSPEEIPTALLLLLL